MKRVRLAAVSRWRRGAFLAAFLVAAPLFAAPKKPKEPQKPAAKPAPAAPASPALPPAPIAQKPPVPATPAAPAKPAPTTDDLYEGPAPVRPKPATPAPAADGKIAAPLSPGPKFADAWPSEFRKPESDLLLVQAGEGRAQAMAEYVRGLTADKRGDADLALEAWKRAASLDPENSDLAVKVAFELAKRNEPGEAIRVLKDCIAAAPKEPRTLVYLSQIYAKHLNKPDLALAAAQKAIEVAPDNFTGWVATYELHQQAGDKKKAAEVFDRILKSTSKDPEFWLQFGNYLWRRMGKPEEKPDAPPAEDDLRQMEFAFRKAAELKPDDASALTQAGDFFALARNLAPDFFTRMRDPKQPVDFYERATKLNQAPRDLATKSLPEKYAKALKAAGRVAEAITALERLANDPRQPISGALYEELGQWYEETGQVDKAVEHFRQTLVLDTSEPKNHYRLEDLLLRVKRVDAAIETMETARKKFRDDPGVTVELARVYMIGKRYQDALSMYEAAAIEARGRNENRLRPEFFEAWSAAAERAGKFDRAVELLKKLIADYPEFAGGYNDLGYLWVERNMNVEEAGDMIKKAVEMEPKNPSFLDSLGWYYFQTGKFEDAKRELLNALAQMEKDEPTVLEHLGDTYQKLGNTKEAVQYWERALKLEPDNADKVRTKIEEGKKKLGA
jgi:tetratricopeptide (TPR) repeat protein